MSPPKPESQERGTQIHSLEPAVEDHKHGAETSKDDTDSVVTAHDSEDQSSSKLFPEIVERRQCSTSSILRLRHAYSEYSSRGALPNQGSERQILNAARGITENSRHSDIYGSGRIETSGGIEEETKR